MCLSRSLSQALLAWALCGMSACGHQRVMPGPIVTDRPDQTEGTDLVAPGWWQAEGGVTAFTPRSGPQSREIGELLLRYGAGPRFEARVEMPSVITSQARRREVSEGALGFKTPIVVPRVGASRAIPAISLLASTSVSTHWADGPVLSTPEVIVAGGWGLSDRWDVSANLVSMPFSRYATDRFVGLTFTTGLAINERLGTYAEIYNLGVPTLNGGLTYRLTPGFQVDARLGLADANSARDRTVFTGAGFGVRW